MTWVDRLDTFLWAKKGKLFATFLSSEFTFGLRCLPCLKLDFAGCYGESPICKTGRWVQTFERKE